MRRWRRIAMLGAFTAVCAAANHPPLATENVVLVTLDGLRWQEVFHGADPALMNAESGGIKDLAGAKHDFWRDTPEERREALLPFLWKVVARQGQIFGNRDRQSVVEVRNGHNFSYPGYNEMLTGAVDPRIDSNDKKQNPNLTVLEWLEQKPAFHARVAAFCSWDAFPFILGRGRSGVFVNAAREPVLEDRLTRRQRFLNEEVWKIPRGSDHRSDALTVSVALEWLKKHRPRVLYLNLSDTDGWAHLGRYDEVLKAAHADDDLLGELWSTLRSNGDYRGNTTLLITTDHGRGNAPNEWKVHGARVEGAQFGWIAVLGPDTRALGERTGTAAVGLGQIAATVAALLGQDYREAAPGASPAIDQLLGSRKRE